MNAPGNLDNLNNFLLGEFPSVPEGIIYREDDLIYAEFRLDTDENVEFATTLSEHLVDNIIYLLRNDFKNHIKTKDGLDINSPFLDQEREKSTIIHTELFMTCDSSYDLDYMNNVVELNLFIYDYDFEEEYEIAINTRNKPSLKLSIWKLLYCVFYNTILSSRISLSYNRKGKTDGTLIIPLSNSQKQIVILRSLLDLFTTTYKLINIISEPNWYINISNLHYTSSLSEGKESVAESSASLSTGDLLFNITKFCLERFV